MHTILIFALLGLGQGALIAGVALGIVLTYRGSGIINLATGAIAMVAAYSFWALKNGILHFTLSTAPALVVTLVVVLVMGVLSELLAFRPLRNSSPLAKLSASLGVLLIAQAGVLLGFGTNQKQAPSILPTTNHLLWGAPVGEDRLILTGTVIAVAILLTAAYRWMRFGLATRAASENETSAMLAGLSTSRLSMANTLLASTVAGSVGVLAASLATLDSTTLPLQVVPALAAALIARFTSFGLACAAGIALGMLQNILYYLSTLSWFPKDHSVALPGVQQLLVFVVIVLAMFWRGASLPGRGELVEKRLPIAPRPERLLRPSVIAAIAGVAALIVFPFDFRQALINSLIGTVILLSLVVITGYVGQLSVVQLALSGTAGFAVSHFAVDHGIGFPLGAVIGIAIATAIGLFTAVSALRVRGVALAVVTLAGAVAIEQFGFVNQTWGGGASGSPVPQPGIGAFYLGNDNSFRGVDGKLPSPVFGFFVLAVTILLCLLVANLRRSSLGQRMLAVRSNERAAAAAGINVRNVKLAAFGIGSFIAGTAGVLYAYNFGSVSSSRFSALTALGLIAFAYIGGITMVQGAIFAGFISTEALFPHAFEKWFGLSGNWALLVGGIALIFTLWHNPEGIAGTNYKKKLQKQRLAAMNPDAKTGVAALTARLRGAGTPGGSET